MDGHGVSRKELPDSENRRGTRHGGCPYNSCLFAARWERRGSRLRNGDGQRDGVVDDRPVCRGGLQNVANRFFMRTGGDSALGHVVGAITQGNGVSVGHSVLLSARRELTLRRNFAARSSACRILLEPVENLRLRKGRSATRPAWSLVRCPAK